MKILCCRPEEAKGFWQSKAYAESFLQIGFTTPAIDFNLAFV
jgi:hypothetical protein